MKETTMSNATCDSVCETPAACAGQPIEDVQNYPDARHLAIDRVGIKSIRHPVKVMDKSSGVQHTIANFSIMVNTAGQSSVFASVRAGRLSSTSSSV